MGFFSWETCDTNESVMNSSTDQCKTVYFLLPDGKPALKEAEYDGYGVFADTDAYLWLIEVNAAHLGIDLSGIATELRRNMGISLAMGMVCKDTQTGNIWSFNHQAEANKALFGGHAKECTVNVFETWSTPIESFSASALELIDSGRFERVFVHELLELRYPIKVSFSPSASYHAHPASNECPNQGYFS